MSSLELPRLHLVAVLCALEVSHLGHDPVDGAVEAGDLGVEHVDEAPHQCLALVGHLCALDGDAVHDDADRLAQSLEGVVLVPDLSAVELAALGRAAEEGEVLADGGGGGSGCGCGGIDHDDLLLVHPPRRYAPW